METCKIESDCITEWGAKTPSEIAYEIAYRLNNPIRIKISDIKRYSIGSFMLMIFIVGFYIQNKLTFWK